MKNRAYNIRHAGIEVFSIKESIRWYGKYFGLKLLVENKLSPEYTKALFGTTNTIKYAKLGCVDSDIKQKHCPCLLELYEVSGGIETYYPYWNHISLTVPDIETLYKSMKNTNIYIYNKPIFDETRRNKLFFCRDCDSNLIEVVQEMKWNEPIS